LTANQISASLLFSTKKSEREERRIKNMTGEDGLLMWQMRKEKRG
jgi:hypothetical protein